MIVNISSIAALTAMGSNVIYCASKAAVDNMTKSLARALAPKIRVVSVAPGVVDNDFIRSMDPRWLEEQVGRTPLKRLAAPEEVASAVIAAIKHLTFTTGSIIPVDGGRPLSSVAQASACAVFAIVFTPMTRVKAETRTGKSACATHSHGKPT